MFGAPRVERWDVSPRGKFLLWRQFRPEQLFVGSFFLLVLLCTLGFRFVPAFYQPGKVPLGWTDAFFTATSAVCITGLVVVDTATYFNFWGQLWILIFMQLGGLGVIVLSSFIILSLGGRLSLRMETLSNSAPDIAPRVNRGKLTRDIIVFTFLAEIVGAIALFLLWRSPDSSTAQTAWDAIFHAVSAFCNSGFSTIPGGLPGQYHHTAILLVTATLVIFGGIGFLAIEEIYRHIRARVGHMRLRLSIHTRLVLWTTAILLVFGTIAYAALEWNNPHTLGKDGVSVGDQLGNAFFMSVTARSSGFHSLDYTKAYAGTNFFTVLLMGIGGSPGSTAGGLKTTTVALLFLLAWNRFRGQPVISIWGRTLPTETVQRAVGLFVFIFVIATTATLALTLTEPKTNRDDFLLYCMFEATSAFFTVGLSIMDSGTLTPSGKWIDIVLMFLGRVGVLTFAAAIALREDARDRTFRYAKEDVVIG